MIDTVSRRLDFSDVKVYGVVSITTPSSAILSRIEKALAGGLDAVQLRAKNCSDREFLRLGHQIKALCIAHGAIFIVNDRADLCLALEADGVHVGHNDLPISTVRELIGHRKLIGASTHSVAQALEAQRAGADYVSCGPLWATPTKPDYPAVGLKLVGLYKASLRIPFVAIGGLDLSNMDQVINAGAPAVAAVRSIFDAADPAETVRLFKEKFKLVSKF